VGRSNPVDHPRENSIPWRGSIDKVSIGMTVGTTGAKDRASQSSDSRAYVVLKGKGLLKCGQENQEIEGWTAYYPTVS